MMDWREKLRNTGQSLGEFSVDRQAATCILNGLGSKYADLPKLLKGLGISSTPEDTDFQKAVSVLNYVSPRALPVIDFKSGMSRKEVVEEMYGFGRTCIILYKPPENGSKMTAFIRTEKLMTNPIGQLVVRPGIRFISERDGVEIWEQKPSELIRCLASRNQGEQNA